MMGAVLEQAGFSVAQAADGEEALALFDSERPELVILDVEMPGMDGIEVCRRLRQRSDARHIPVVMATGLDDIASINAAYAAGATDFIPKPVNWGLMGHRVRYILRASQASRDLADSEEHFRLITESSSDFIAMLDRDGRRVYSSPSYRQHFGTDELAGTDSFREIHPEDRDEIRRVFRETVDTGVGREAAFRWVLGDGGVRYLESRGNVIRDEAGEVSRVVVVSRDVTERKEKEREVEYLAYYDSLTGLHNRRFFLETLATLTETSRKGERLAVVVLDIRGFHVVNDNLGRQAGDALLKVVAQRLGSSLSAADTVGRIGGDQFGLILVDVPAEAQVAAIVERVMGALENPFDIGGESIRISTHAGASLFPADGASAGELLTHAEAALKKAKAGPDRCLFYAPHLNAALANRLALENALRRALERREFTLLYQPKVDLVTGRAASLEALLYWNDPAVGLVSPARFIPVLEETGMILAVGSWVVRQAIADLGTLRSRGHGSARIAVNVSPIQFRQKDFPAYLAEAMGSHRGPGLDIEITESVMMEDIESCVHVLWRLRELGIGVALDDFGTGFSSLSYIARLPATTLKVDKSFVGEMVADPGRLAIVKAVVSLAHALGMKVVAEGVETEEQAAILRSLACDEAQGYLHGRPAPLDEASRLLALG